jgi:fatty acid desaturase
MESTHPLLSQVRRNLKVRWYRCPIEKEELRSLMQRSDLRGAFQAVGHLALWAATGGVGFLCFYHEMWIGFAIALWLHGTVGSFMRGIGGHELVHGTVFRTMWLNRFFVRVYSTLGWFNFQEYRMSHTYHHRFTLHPDGDREVVLPRNPMLRLLHWLQLLTVNLTFRREANGLFPVVWGHLRSAFNRYPDPWIEAVYEGHPEARREAVNWSRWTLLFHLVTASLFIIIGQPILIVFVNIFFCIANWLKHFVGLPMHCGLRDNVPDFRLCVRTITLDPISEFLYWRMNWHTEHHMFAGVPCYNLARLYRQVKDDMPVPRTLIGAWREMRDTWRRQQKDPNYVFNTPLPPTAHPPVLHEKDVAESDELASSIGDLAPEALA